MLSNLTITRHEIEGDLVWAAVRLEILLRYANVRLKPFEVGWTLAGFLRLRVGQTKCC